MVWTEEQFSAFQSDRGKTAQQAASPKKSTQHKFRAIPCIVTEDLTLFTKPEIYQADALSGNPLSGTGTLIERGARAGIVGERFDSTKEGKRWIVLRRLEQTSDVSYLQRQTVYPLLVNEIQIGKWITDFEYTEYDPTSRQFTRIREDSKGVRTALYQRSKKHVEAQYGFRIRET